MVCRRIGVVVLALLAFTLLISARAECSSWIPTFPKHEMTARSEFPLHRQSDSVLSSLSTTGDPDEIATANPRNGGQTHGGFGGLIDSQPVLHGWLKDRVGVCSAFLRYFLFRLR